MVILEKKVDGAAVAELSRFVRKAQSLTGVSGEVDVLITGNARVRELNRRFRSKNKPTDVLSFPRIEGGDIAISVDIARENAKHFGHSAMDELKVLVLHGMLHLAGYDHERDNGRMAARETRLRAQLKLPNSLIERGDAGAKKAAGDNKAAGAKKTAGAKTAQSATHTRATRKRRRRR